MWFLLSRVGYTKLSNSREQQQHSLVTQIIILGTAHLVNIAEERMNNSVHSLMLCYVICEGSVNLFPFSQTENLSNCYPKCIAKLWDSLVSH